MGNIRIGNTLYQADNVKKVMEEYDRTVKEKKNTSIEKKEYSNAEDKKRLLKVVEALPVVGKVTAKKLLEKYKSLNVIFNLTSEELITIEDISLKEATEIEEFINAMYK